MTLKDILIAGKLTISEGGGGGGGGTSDLDNVALNDVVFIDYNGEVVYTYNAAEFLSMNAMPNNPAHDGLLAQGWNWTLADAKEYVQNNGMLLIGQNYTTSDGQTKAYLSVTSLTVEAPVGIRIETTVKNGVTIHWGDGSTTVADANANASKEYQHTYSAPGDYVISIECTSGKYSIGGTGGNDRAFYTENNKTCIHRGDFKKIHLGDNIARVYQYAFNSMTELQELSLSAGIGEFGTNRSDCFQSCRKLQALVYPPNATWHAGYSPINNSFNLRFVSVPKNGIANMGDNNSFYIRMITLPPVSSLPSGIGGFGFRLEKVSVPGTYTSVPSNLIRETDILEKITIPASVTSVPASTLTPARNIKEYHFKPTTPPTLASSSNIFTVNSGVRIFVPYSADHSILNAYKTATNWTNYASYIVEEPQ